MKAVEVDDGEIMTIGSFNQDHYSFYVNNEANLYLRLQDETSRFDLQK